MLVKRPAHAASAAGRSATARSRSGCSPSTPEPGASSSGTSSDETRARADLQLRTGCSEERADLLAIGAGSMQRPGRPSLSGAEACAPARHPDGQSAGRSPIRSTDRAARGSDHVGARLAARAPRLALRGCAAPRPADAASKPCGSRAVSWKRICPTIPVVSCSHRAPSGSCSATCEANSSATPTAIPSTANSSCTSLLRRRTR